MPRLHASPIIVIGAGLGGLTAAAILTRHGLPVRLLERAPAPGGRARTTERDGFLLNLGPHALGLRGPSTRVLRDLRIGLPGRTPVLAATRFLRDEQLVHPLARHRGGAGPRLVPALARFRRLPQMQRTGGSVAQLLDPLTDDPSTAAILAAVARLTTYADAFEDQAGDVLIEQLRAGRVRYLDGGWGSLVGRLREVVLAGGGHIEAGVGVEAVHPSGGGVGPALVGLRDGRELPAAAVIVAVGGPRDTVALLGDASGDAVRRWADRATSVRLAALDLALRRRPAMPAIVLGADRPVYVSVHSDRSRLAAGDGAVVQLARFLPMDRPAPPATRSELEHTMDQVARGWRNEVVHARYLPDLVLTHDGARAATGGTVGRPGPEVPGAPGVFVAGDWVGPRGYLAQATLSSASQAADLAATYVAGRQVVTDRRVARG